jgi:hypothetical protein
VGSAEPKTLMEIFADEGWDKDEPPLEARTQTPMGDPDSRPTQMVDLLIIDRSTADLLTRFCREDGIEQGEVLAEALKLYDAQRKRRKA